MQGGYYICYYYRGKNRKFLFFKCARAGPLITLEDIDQNECRALGGEEGSVRERGLLGVQSKRLLDHLNCIVVWRAAI